MKFKVIKTIRFQSVCFSDDSSSAKGAILRLQFFLLVLFCSGFSA